MDVEQLELHPRIIAAVRKANLRSARAVLSLSAPDVQRVTRLSLSDVKHLHACVASAYRCRPPVTALQLSRGECPALEPLHRLSLGCPLLDGLLRGGIPLTGITEVAGESGVGKTQLGLQLSLCVQYPQEYGGLASGVVYICTEDCFPIKRLHQLIAEQPHLRPDVPADVQRSLRLSDNIYIEHTADLAALQSCVSQRVRILLLRRAVRLVVLDSVAALFRSDFQAEEAPERARHLLQLAGKLQQLSYEFHTPVLCINQVTDVISHSDLSHCNFGLTDSRVLPSLGMAWANQVLVRLMLRRDISGQSGTTRRLQVVFAPHLPQESCLCSIGAEGVRGVTAQDSVTKS